MLRNILIATLMLGLLAACEVINEETPISEHSGSVRVDGYLFDMTYVSRPIGGFDEYTDENGEVHGIHWDGWEHTTTVTARAPFTLEETDQDLADKAIKRYCGQIGLTYEFDYASSYFEGTSWINEGSCT